MVKSIKKDCKYEMIVLYLQSKLSIKDYII